MISKAELVYLENEYTSCRMTLRLTISEIRKFQKVLKSPKMLGIE